MNTIHYKLFCFVFTLFAICPNILSAQTSRFKNDEGRWILLNPQTGVWVYETDALRADSLANIAKNNTANISKPPVDSLAPPKGMHTIIVDGKAVFVPDTPTNVSPEPSKTSVSLAVAPTDSIAPNTPDIDVFATPEEEYRTKAAAAGAATKQDDALTSTRKSTAKKAKNDKNNNKNKASAKAEKPSKSKKNKAMPSYCNLATDEVDEFTGKEKKIGKPIMLFSFTPEAARKYMRSDDYLLCTANFSRIGSFKTLNLTITIDSQFGQSEYGTIETGSVLIIKMIDGSTVELVCDKGDAGRVDKVKNQTIYNVFYIVESGFERQLNGGEASKVRLVWSVGFEDYEIYDVDFFTKHIKCIN